MQNAYHTTATVLPGNRIEVATPELREGCSVQVVVIPHEVESPGSSGGQSALEIIKGLKGHRLFQSPEEVDRFINEERDSWER